MNTSLREASFSIRSIYAIEKLKSGVGIRRFGRDTTMNIKPYEIAKRSEGAEVKERDEDAVAPQRSGSVSRLWIVRLTACRAEPRTWQRQMRLVRRRSSDGYDSGDD